MRYLVATDGSTESDDAVRHAAAQAVDADAALEIVHVLTPEPELVEGQVVLPGEDAATETGERLLDRAVELATDVADERDQPLVVETELLAGRPADAITDRAESADVDAIYVGHRGISETSGRAVGSVAKSVLDKATVPVTVIR